MIKAVLFDLDGTLVDSIRDLADSTNYALAGLGFPTRKTELFYTFVGDGIPKLIERALPAGVSPEIREAALQRFMEHYRVHYADQTVCYPGIPELVAQLRAAGLLTAVISNKAQEMAVIVTEKLLGGQFDCITGKQPGFATKPDPALTLKVIHELGVLPQECVLVGDSGMDMAAAVNAGCKAIGVLWGFRSREELTANGGQFLAERPEQILDLIKEF